MAIAALVWLLNALSVLATLFTLIPSPNMAFYAPTVGLPELAVWMVPFHLVAAGLSWRFRRRLTPVALFGAAVALRPFTQLPGKHPPFWTMVRDSIGGVWHSEPSSEALPRNMLLYRPAQTGPRPAVIDIYGGAWQRGKPSENLQFHSWLVDRGYVVFSIDYRHAPEYRFPAQIEDVRASIAHIRDNAARYNVDPEAIVLCGRSAGGHLALLAAYEPDAAPVRGVIAFYPPTDLRTGYLEPPRPDPIDSRKVLLQFLGGPPDQLPEIYRTASPSTYVRSGLPPTLLIHGLRDHIVKAAFSQSLYRSLGRAGSPVTLVELPWSEHAFDVLFSGLGNLVALHAVEGFLTQTVSGVK